MNLRKDHYRKASSGSARRWDRVGGGRQKMGETLGAPPGAMEDHGSVAPGGSVLASVGWLGHMSRIVWLGHGRCLLHGSGGSATCL